MFILSLRKSAVPSGEKKLECKKTEYLASISSVYAETGCQYTEEEEMADVNDGIVEDGVSSEAGRQYNEEEEMADINGAEAQVLDEYLTCVPAVINSDGNRIFEVDRMFWNEIALGDANTTGDHYVEEDGIAEDGVSSEAGRQYNEEEVMADINGVEAQVLEEYMTMCWNEIALGDANTTGDHDVKEDGIAEDGVSSEAGRQYNEEEETADINGAEAQVLEEYLTFWNEIALRDANTTGDHDVEEDGIAEDGVFSEADRQYNEVEEMDDINGAEAQVLEEYLTCGPAAINSDGNQIFEEDGMSWNQIKFEENDNYKVEYLLNAFDDVNAAEDQFVEEDGMTGDGFEMVEYLPLTVYGDGTQVEKDEYDGYETEYLANDLDGGDQLDPHCQR